MNFLSQSGLDRRSEHRTDDAWVKELLDLESSRFVPIWNDKVLVSQKLPLEAVFLSSKESRFLISQAREVIFLGLTEENVAYFALSLDGERMPIEGRPGIEFQELRSVALSLGAFAASVLAHAQGLIYWHKRSRFCSVCGNATELKEAGYMRHCLNSECGSTHFPRTDPAIIVRVVSGDRCLLARHANRSFFTVLAGFVEPGESLEDAVVREVFEEVGIRVRNVQYHSSQPWPFPASLMLGFTADAVDDKIRIDEKEILEARWLSRKEFGAALESGEIKIPTAISIASRLIREWFESPSL